MAKMSDEYGQIRKLNREISSIQSKTITTQGYGVSSGLNRVTGGREYLDNLSFSDAVKLDSADVKIIGVEFDYDFNCGEWAK